MARWLNRTCARIRSLARSGDIHFTAKATAELHALGLFLDRDDAIDVLGVLSPRDFHRRLRALDGTGWNYVFRPRIAGHWLYVKLALRTRCVVISFHDQEDTHDES